MTQKQPDEADRMKAGTLARDPKSNVRPIAMQVPRVLTVLDLLKASYSRLTEEQRRAAHCTTGHYRLDKITGGFRPGFTWLVGATTSWGKSSWAVSVADENIRAGKRVLIVSSEDTEEVYGDRLLVRRAKVDALRFRDARLHQDEHQRVAGVVQSGEQLPAFVDARRYPVEDLAGHIGTIIREHKIDLVMFDYVQEFRTRRRFQDERTKFKEIASVLRNVTKDAKVAGVLFSQLTTDENTRVPTRLNIRECRDMAHAAEVIMLGFESDQETKDRQGNVIALPGQKCMHVDKVKNGPRGAKVPMAWNQESACFDVVEDPEVERIRQIAGADIYDVGQDPMPAEGQWWDR